LIKKFFKCKSITINRVLIGQRKPGVFGEFNFVKKKLGKTLEILPIFQENIENAYNNPGKCLICLDTYDKNSKIIISNFHEKTFQFHF
jgi:hypothetical protein